MKKRNKIILIIIVLLLGAGSVLGYMKYTNRGPFEGFSLAGLPDNHIKFLNKQLSQHPFELLFNAYGGVYFNGNGKDVNVYLSYYKRDELVLHESLASIGFGNVHVYSGYVLWGLTMKNNLPDELRVDMLAGGGKCNNTFDFSSLDIEPRVVINPA